jgi:hypothetical protein
MVITWNAMLPAAAQIVVT